jgi:hypothetical protein
MEVVRNIVHAVTWMLMGMVMMARFFCNQLAIDSHSPLFIGWDTVAFTAAALMVIQALVWLDPSFKE